ncbi:CrcB family protein [Planomonospora corallina]|uniref:Fluoride-specific ion channel FluC n=1 Tax=Planomonospora corallina TaxID=1806052 RepID=A0ABV8IFZ4_9ACTN
MSDPPPPSPAASEVSGSPVGSDAGPRPPARQAEPPPRWQAVTMPAVVAVGGVLGALARYGLVSAFPHPPGGFPWATFAVNVAGCALIGVLMVLITETWQAHRLVRPFLGVGVLGGFTTFSAYVADIAALAAAGAERTALLYLPATVAGAVTAVHLAAAATRALTGAAARRSRSSSSMPGTPAGPGRPRPDEPAGEGPVAPDGAETIRRAGHPGPGEA